MPKLYTTNIFLEERETELLSKHNFSEEIHEKDIHEDDEWMFLMVDVGH